MTKRELVTNVALKQGIPQKQVSPIIEQFIIEQKNALLSGKSIFIRGFGSLNITTRKAKTGRLIKAGKQITIPEHKIVKFKAAPRVKAAVKKLAL